MRTISKINTGYSQLKWVVLLLGIAVILPTMCLLWFMSQAMKNERLAVKQKLTDVYKVKLEELSKKIDELWTARIESIEQQAISNRSSVEVFKILAGRSNGAGASKVCDSIIIFDNNRRLIYPVVREDEYPGELSEQFEQAWGIEFAEEDYGKAISLYEEIADSFVDDYTSYSALMGKVRCLRKSGEIEKAVALCHEIAYEQNPEDVSSSSSVSLIARARILFIKLKSETAEGLELSDMQNLVGSALSYTPSSIYIFLPMSSQTRIFFLHRVIEIAEKSEWAGRLRPQIQQVKELLLAEELAAVVLDKYYIGTSLQPWSEDNVLRLASLLRTTVDSIEEVEWSWTEQLKPQISRILDLFNNVRTDSQGFDRPVSAALFDSWPENSLRRLNLSEEVFGIYHNVGNKTFLLLQESEKLNSELDLCGDGLKKEPGVNYRIVDNSELYVCGLENPVKAPFMRESLGQYFPGWQVEVHFDDIDIFEKTAGKQAVLYMWAGVLAIAVMIAASLLAVQAVGKQIKTNKLKNDFIATVSHELKTPLASMRVLVDTLLEGNYKDQKQATEYLQLTSHENERLSRLIDNFLSFSRMERNKQAFNMVKTSSTEIAHDAVEAVKTKLSQDGCEFKVEICEGLPDVWADHDAMVTVLVNLLDNAYKYSYDNKNIQLKAYAENGLVYYSVSDRGIGMSRRSIKKIFKRFYQEDRSLTRKAEGCGLGLSIAKFIVDAHKGTIFVESRISEGSTFTVRLPVCG